MRDLRAAADDAVFDLHKVADLDMVADAAVRTDVGKGTDRRVRADDAVIRLGGVDLRFVADGAAADHGVRTDRAVFADDRIALQNGARQDQRTAADLHARVDIGGVRVQDVDAVCKMLFQDLLAAHRLCGAQLLLIADREEALHDLRALGKRGKRAVLPEHFAAFLCPGAVNCAAGEYADRQHRAVDDDHAVLRASEQLLQLLCVLRAVHIRHVGAGGGIGAHPLMRAHVGNNKKPLNAKSHQFCIHPCQNRAEHDGLKHQRRLFFGQGHIVRHEKNCDFSIHRIFAPFFG